MATLPLVGEELAGYRLRSVIGRGGMSVVFQAENPRLGSLIALKVLAPEIATNDVFRARFLQESRSAASLSHPNVIPIYDMGTSGDLLYIAMRHVTGGDLRAALAREPQLPVDQALSIVAQTGRALDDAHRHGLIHRDVKPGNILIERGSEDHDADHVYLADFGITKHAASMSGLTMTGEFMGTIDYIAPEQIQGQQIDGRADIYSLGCVLYECLTGRVPFIKQAAAAVIWAHVEESPTAPSEIRPELPPALDDVIAKALAKNPDDRYQTCREFVMDAQAAASQPRAASKAAMTTDLPVTPRPPERAGDPPAGGGGDGAAPPPDGAAGSSGTTGGPTGDGPQKRRRLIGAAAVVVIGLAIAGYFIISGGGSTPTSAATSNALLQTLANTNKSAEATGLIPPNSCHAPSGTSNTATCTNPSQGVTTATFTTYPSLNAVYDAYEQQADAISDRPAGSAFKQNYGRCNSKATDGESSWNHNFKHPLTYTVDDLMNQNLDENKAAGRLFCSFQGGQFHIVWTQNDGNLVGSLVGDNHESAQHWWHGVHHNIQVAGAAMGAMGSPTPMDMNGSGG